jgi:hypothetical protein
MNYKDYRLVKKVELMRKELLNYYKHLPNVKNFVLTGHLKGTHFKLCLKKFEIHRKFKQDWLRTASRLL